MVWLKLLLTNPKFVTSLGTLVVSIAASLGFVMEESTVIEALGYIATLTLMVIGAKETAVKKKQKEGEA